MNPTETAVDIPLELRNAKLLGGGTRWQIAGADPMAYNDPEHPGQVQIEEQAVSGVPRTIKVSPCSVRS